MSDGYRENWDTGSDYPQFMHGRPEGTDVSSLTHKPVDPVEEDHRIEDGKDLLRLQFLVADNKRNLNTEQRALNAEEERIIKARMEGRKLEKQLKVEEIADEKELLSEKESAISDEEEDDKLTPEEQAIEDAFIKQTQEPGYVWGSEYDGEATAGKPWIDENGTALDPYDVPSPYNQRNLDPRNRGMLSEEDSDPEGKKKEYPKYRLADGTVIDTKPEEPATPWYEDVYNVLKSIYNALMSMVVVNQSEAEKKKASDEMVLGLIGDFNKNKQAIAGEEIEKKDDEFSGDKTNKLNLDTLNTKQEPFLTAETKRLWMGNRESFQDPKDDDFLKSPDGEAWSKLNREIRERETLYRQLLDADYKLPERRELSPAEERLFQGSNAYGVQYNSITGKYDQGDLLTDQEKRRALDSYSQKREWYWDFEPPPDNDFNWGNFGEDEQEPNPEVELAKSDSEIEDEKDLGRLKFIEIDRRRNLTALQIKNNDEQEKIVLERMERRRLGLKKEEESDEVDTELDEAEDDEMTAEEEADFFEASRLAIEDANADYRMTAEEEAEMVRQAIININEAYAKDGELNDSIIGVPWIDEDGQKLDPYDVPSPDNQRNLDPRNIKGGQRSMPPDSGKPVSMSSSAVIPVMVPVISRSTPLPMPMCSCISDTLQWTSGKM